MKIINTLFITCLVLLQLTAFASEKEEFAIIRGKVNFAAKSGIIKLQNSQEGELADFSSTRLGENGMFGFMVAISEPGFYHIRIPGYGQLLRVYLRNGLELDLDVSEEDYVLSGKEVGPNRLVVEWNKTIEPALKINREPRMSFKDFFPLMEQKIMPKAEELKGELNTKDPDFNKLMGLAIQTDVEQQLYAFWMIPRAQSANVEDYRDLYKQYEREVKFTDPNILKLWNGKAYMKGYLQHYQWVFGKRKKSQFYVQHSISSIEDPQLRDVYLRSVLDFKGLKSNHYKTFVKDARPHMISEQSKSLLFKLDQEMTASDGKLGFNFEYEDINGNMVSFESLRGKVVYVDMWATWCGPCIKQIPYLKELEEELHGEDIAFVSISIDEEKDRAKWKNFVADKELGGIQLIADKAWDSEMVKNYEIKGIPRFMIFDKNGFIVSDNAMRPSQPELKKQLVELLKK
ncbi:hypothetical protein GCM10028791_37470 [Echinicola sediminis]